ncbi:hypothetical protein SAMN05444678_10297 [Sphingomonas sp. YR710]|nr:hypothetical protein SAMN05444678_10297 [Sphingomonas sp. YR710]
MCVMWRRLLPVALGLGLVWLVGTYVLDGLAAPDWAYWAWVMLYLGSWLAIGNSKRFRSLR